jgi:hypothetical protein
MKRKGNWRSIVSGIFTFGFMLIGFVYAVRGEIANSALFIAVGAIWLVSYAHSGG